MKLLNFLFATVFSCLSFSCFATSVGSSYEVADFYKSFLKTYDINGRYTREYHPWLLEQTGHSFLKLETTLKNAGFIVEGRCAIFGFQEDAFSRYLPDITKEQIDDESPAIAHNGGVGKLPKNIFGYITGYMLSDIAYMERALKREPLFHFSAYELPELMNDKKRSTQEYVRHAFGEKYDFIRDTQRKLERKIAKDRDIRGFLDVLVQCWENLYAQAVKNGSQESVASQDILFSINYAKALRSGNAEILKFFSGPDITYPIEASQLQGADATLHAQNFVREFSKFVTARNGQKTGYVFCSFVDGVGKSTLFNNIKNYVQYGSNINAYQRCDNSSSQESSIMKLKEDVFLVDLPAQVSHFTIKPDGFVYADIKNMPGYTDSFERSVKAHIRKHRKELIDIFEGLKKKAVELKDPPYSHCEDIPYTFAQNVVIMGSKLDWVPCEYMDQQVLFSAKNPSLIRVLVPLAGAHSAALKVAEPELMLFTKGILQPMAFDAFMNRLVRQLREAGIERLVFVDFLSMYPRTSRENVRINFMLQYLKYLHGDKYDLQESFYRPTVNGERETCRMMHKRKDLVINGLSLEAALRSGMFRRLVAGGTEGVRTVDGKKLADILRKESDQIIELSGKDIREKATEKVEAEAARCIKEYAHDKEYEAIECFQYDSLLDMSKALATLFMSLGQTDDWAGLDGELVSLDPVRKEHGLSVYKLANGTEVLLGGSIYEGTKDVQLFTPFVREVRAQWYFLLSTLLGWHKRLKPEIAQSTYWPHSTGMVVKRGPDHKMYVVQKYNGFARTGFYQDENQTIISPARIFLLTAKMASPTGTGGHALRRFGVNKAGNKQYCIDWAGAPTFVGLYAFGNESLLYRLMPELRIEDASFLTVFMLNFTVVPKEFLAAADLVTALMRYDWLTMGQKKNYQSLNFLQELSFESNPEKKILAKLWLRAVVTLEMIIKDPEADIFVRRGNKADFCAALKLLEWFVLPRSLAVSSKVPLFSEAEYASIDPLIPWESVV